ncbi:hypothetical protein IFO70_18360 [Phormidium tenue FACHB-886]|nr:hypothetical protein [Phormidium tenue FACHB-886]
MDTSLGERLVVVLLSLVVLGSVMTLTYTLFTANSTAAATSSPLESPLQP